MDQQNLTPLQRQRNAESLRVIRRELDRQHRERVNRALDWWAKQEKKS